MLLTSRKLVSYIFDQARNQKFAIGGCYGVGAPSRRTQLGCGDEATAVEIEVWSSKLLYFFAKIT